MILSFALCLLSAGGPADAPASRLAVIRKAPDFALVNQDGKTVKLSDFRGRLVLVSFIFTTCNGTCPATTHRMAKIYEAISVDQGYGGYGAYGQAIPAPVVFLSVTLDPQRDTTDALKKYAQLYDLQASAALKKGRDKSWMLLTGSPEVVDKTLEAWGMWAKPGPSGQLDHPSRIFLLDQQGRIREIYNVEMLRVQDVAADLMELAKER